MWSGIGAVGAPKGLAACKSVRQRFAEPRTGGKCAPVCHIARAWG